MAASPPSSAGLALRALLTAAACLHWTTTAVRADEEWQNWQSDVTDSMNIGASLTGYRRVGLRCAAEHMEVEVEMEEDFDGVLYTRGAFHSQEQPCFLDARGGRNFTLRLPLAKCNTRNEKNVYTNTIVIQYDDELIMPGDAAFKLECDFQNTRSYTVSANLETNRDFISSRIILEDADPAAEDKPKKDRLTATSTSSFVSFTPDSAKTLKKDEL